MIKISGSSLRAGHPLVLASVLALLSVTPTTARPDSTACTPSDPAALRACFHSAEFNVVDDLSDDGKDLSARGAAPSTSGATKEVPVTAKSSDAIPVTKAPAPKLDDASLRAYFRSAVFNVSDGPND